MRTRSSRRLTGLVVVVLAIVALAACGDSDSSSSSPTSTSSSSAPEADAATTQTLVPGPVTVVALGDSLTAGDGDDEGLGFVGRITETVGEAPGREGSTLVNLGQSGWDSTMMVDGQDGSPAQLATAVDEVRSVVEGGGAALATVLIGSNDLWYLYEYGPEEGTGPEAEDDAVELLRTNLDRTVTELQEAGAFVVVGLPDDQSLRPGVADFSRLQDILPAVTEDEVDQMSALSVRFDEVAAEVAADHGALTVDTNDPFWADEATMADDGIHPEGAGYEVLAALWMDVIGPALVAD